MARHIDQRENGVLRYSFRNQLAALYTSDLHLSVKRVYAALITRDGGEYVPPE